MPKEGEETIGEMPEPPEPEELPDDEPEEPDEMRPTEEMAKNAADALEARRSAPADGRPLTRAQVDRAKRIANRERMTARETKRMAAFFTAARATRPDGDATGTPWLAAWLANGGDAGDVWTADRT